MRDEFKQLCFDAQDYLADGHFPQAIKTYRRALAQSQDDMEKYFALSFIGAAYDDEDKQRMALLTFKECQELAEKCFGKNSFEFAVSLSNEGMVYSNRHQSKRAEPLLDAAVQILRSLGQDVENSSLPTAWESIVEVFANTAECKARLGKKDEALTLMKEACELAKANLPSDNSRRVQASLELGALLASLGQTKYADVFSEEVLIGLGQSMNNPQAAFQMVQQIIANTSSFLEGIEAAEFASTKKKTTKKAAPSLDPRSNTNTISETAGFIQSSLKRL